MEEELCYFTQTTPESRATASSTIKPFTWGRQCLSIIDSLVWLCINKRKERRSYLLNLVSHTSRRNSVELVRITPVDDGNGDQAGRERKYPPRIGQQEVATRTRTLIRKLIITSRTRTEPVKWRPIFTSLYHQ